MNLCILGRQPEIGLAELEALYGAEHIRPIGTTCALVDVPVDFSRLGGTVKVAEIVTTTSGTTLRPALAKVTKLLPRFATELPEGKVKLGLSLYDFDVRPYDINGESLRLKKILRRANRSVRVIPNEAPALSSAQTFHNSLTSELGLEFVFAHDGSQTYVGRVTHVQNIDDYRIRDRERPKRDAFVGMLPPKLAQIIVNLAMGRLESRVEDAAVDSEMPHKRVVRGGADPKYVSSDETILGADRATGPAHSDLRSEAYDGSGQKQTNVVILDPFCGTGVVPQEALLMGYKVYGSDKSAKMIDYSKANINWLGEKFALPDAKFEVADATDHIWLQPITAIAAEGYLGQPLGGQNPTAEKLKEIIHDSNATMRGFLKNIAPQLALGTRLCIAMPAWFVRETTHHLPVIDELNELGFEPVTFTHAPHSLLYRREDQVVGRELVVLKRR